jgi:hypothetical protein
MKYYNKRRRFRDAGWYQVVLSDSRRIWDTIEWNQLKLWCQQQPGRGTFSTGPYGRRIWYFELQSDATWFALNWL